MKKCVLRKATRGHANFSGFRLKIRRDQTNPCPSCLDYHFSGSACRRASSRFLEKSDGDPDGKISEVSPTRKGDTHRLLYELRICEKTTHAWPRQLIVMEIWTEAPERSPKVTKRATRDPQFLIGFNTFGRKFRVLSESKKAN